MTKIDQARAALQSVFGYDDFRPGQAEIVGAVLASGMLERLKDI